MPRAATWSSWMTWCSQAARCWSAASCSRLRSAFFLPVALHRHRAWPTVHQLVSLPALLRSSLAVPVMLS